MPDRHGPTLRYCDEDSPMPFEDRHRYHWIHKDAKDVGEFFGMRVYTCPHCGTTFHARPRT